jgi:hypothetical protein
MMAIPAVIPSFAATAIILATLAAVLAASWITFWVLGERSTVQRQSVALLEWGRDHGFRLRECPAGPPEPLADLRNQGVVVRTCLAGQNRMLLRLERAEAHEAPAPAARRAPAGPGRWNLLVRTTRNLWPPTGLRPVQNPHSALDLFSLTSFPLLGPTDRFIVYGTDGTAARKLSRASARGLLPPDVGLLLAGPHLILDFSARPFDEIEFNRMIVVADQLLKHVPERP